LKSLESGIHPGYSWGVSGEIVDEKGDIMGIAAILYG
jgi:hypothetical protein